MPPGTAMTLGEPWTDQVEPPTAAAAAAAAAPVLDPAAAPYRGDMSPAGTTDWVRRMTGVPAAAAATAAAAELGVCVAARSWLASCAAWGRAATRHRVQAQAQDKYT